MQRDEEKAGGGVGGSVKHSGGKRGTTAEKEGDGGGVSTDYCRQRHVAFATAGMCGAIGSVAALTSTTTGECVTFMCVPPRLRDAWDRRTHMCRAAW